MRRSRLVPAVLTFLVVTVAFGVLLWTLVLMVGIGVFDSPSPECRDSDTCNTFGDVVYPVQDGGLALLAWFGLSGLILAGPFLWLRSRMRSRDTASG